MNFMEAMAILAQFPTGKDKKETAKAMRCPSMSKGFVFYDSTLFLGIQPFGYRICLTVDSESSAYSPTPEDVADPGWEEYDWKKES